MILLVPVLVVTILAPLGALFIFLRRYETEQFWRLFLVCSFCSLAGGAMSFVITFGSELIIGPLLNAYANFATKLFRQFGFPISRPWLLILGRCGLALIMWYLGMAGMAWIVLREHFSHRKGDAANLPAD